MLVGLGEMTVITLDPFAVPLNEVLRENTASVSLVPGRLLNFLLFLGIAARVVFPLASYS